MSPFTACEPLRGQDLAGKVALVLRGDCNFVQKVWHAQRAHAVAIVVMDNELRHEYDRDPGLVSGSVKIDFVIVIIDVICRPPYHIIMMKDDMASSIHIPSVFISYASGEWLLDALSRAVPWDPLRITIDATGECELMNMGRMLL